MKRQWTSLTPQFLLLLGSDGAKLAQEEFGSITDYKSMPYAECRGAGLYANKPGVARCKTRRGCALRRLLGLVILSAQSILGFGTRRFLLLLFMGMC